MEKVIHGFSVILKLLYRKGEDWRELAITEEGDTWKAEDGNTHIEIIWSENPLGMEYELSLSATVPTQVRLELELIGENDLFHLIPSNIFGDINLAKAQVGEYPMLTWEQQEDVFCSPYWEFRADRATQPVSILCCEKGVVGICVNPYTETGYEFVRNGVRAELPNKIAVSLGYTNDPVTFVNKREYWPSTRDICRQGKVLGRIYAVRGDGRLAAHQIIEADYRRTRELPTYDKTIEQAGRALIEQFVQTNWSEHFQNYTNMECHLPHDTKLKPWRQLAEIGWTGGGILAYPFMLAEEELGLSTDFFKGKLSPVEIIDEVVRGYNKESGFFNDVARDDWRLDGNPSPVNGWWAGFHLAEDCHCAYTNGSAVYYILKIMCTWPEQKKEWMEKALQVLETVMSLQREDGNYGNTYRYDKKAVLDWEGFAGCWFAAAMPYAYRLTKDVKYIESADKALDYYVSFVKKLNCYGTPMDTWKSVDEEGNLAFIRATRQMHEITGEQKYLDYLELGAEYQYLWQYGFRARPEFIPLRNSNWNSCGSSVTSVSNPHAHPMGTLIIDDLNYLAKKTDCSYHLMRAEDAFAWLMNTMELYPDVSGYGAYGIMTERYCPSDGLVIEAYDNGEPSSMWFTYNGWAAANALEAILTKIRNDKMQ